MNIKQFRKQVISKALTKEDAKRLQKEAYENKEWYTIRSILGHHDTNWFVLIGARELGKTFSVQDYVLSCFFNPKHPLYHVPFYWMRLSDAALNSMKQKIKCQF